MCFQQMTSKLRLGAPIERHAQDIYTRAIYERFCYLLYKSMDFVIMSRSNGNRFVVVHSLDINKDERKEHVVYLDVGSVIHCSCGLFEHMGIVCRHSLKVGFKIILTGVNWVILYYYIIHVFSRLFLLVRYAKFSFMYFFFCENRSLFL